MNDPSANDLWAEACRHLEKILSSDVYSRWIAVIVPTQLSADSLTLSVDNDFYQTWLEENYLPLIQDAVAAAAGSPLRIRFAVKPPEAKIEEPPRRKSFREHFIRRPRPEIALNPKFKFDDFVVGPSNNFAHAATLAVAQAPARAYNPLFIYGGTGLGKTHLMQAIGHHVLATSRATVSYLSSEAFTNEYIDALQNRALVQFRKKYRNVDLLLIDDIHFLGGKERLQEEFFHTFNVLFDAHKQIVMTSDRPATEITALEQRLVSRFEWGLVTELEPPDLETRIAILRHKMGPSNVALPDSILLFIAERVRSNIRSLEGALIRTLSYASLMGRELTLDAVKYLLRDVLEREQQEDLTFDKIQRAVAEHYDVRIADMSSKRRPRAVALPRQIAMYLCRRMTRASLPDIGNAFGKTHATVLHAFHAVDGRLSQDAALRRDVTDISRKLGKALTLEATPAPPT
jgi:chromosomal replication initiator protein